VVYLKPKQLIIKDCARRFVLKLYGHEASRGLFATAELLVSLRYGDISIFKMAAARHLRIVLPPYETTHEVCCWPQLPIKFHVNLIHRCEDIAI